MRFALYYVCMYRTINCIAAVLVISKCLPKVPGSPCDVQTGWADFNPRGKKKREKESDVTRFN